MKTDNQLPHGPSVPTPGVSGPERPAQPAEMRPRTPGAEDRLEAQRDRPVAQPVAVLAAPQASSAQQLAKRRPVETVSAELWGQVLAGADMGPPALSQLVSEFAGKPDYDALAVAAQDNKHMRAYTPAADQGEASLLDAYDRRQEQKPQAAKEELDWVWSAAPQVVVQASLNDRIAQGVRLSDFDLTMAFMARGCRVPVDAIEPALLANQAIVRNLLQGGERAERIVALGGTAGFAVREVLVLGLRSSPLGLRALAEYVGADRELTALAVLQFPGAFADAHPSLRADKAYFLQLVAAQTKRTEFSEDVEPSTLLSGASEALQDDLDVVLAAIDKDADSFVHASGRLRDHETVALAAIAIAWGLGEYLGPTLCDNKAFLLAAIGYDPEIVEFSSGRLGDDKEIIMEAVRYCGSALAFASDRLCDDGDVVRLALRQDGWALELASRRLRDDPEMVLLAVQNASHVLKFASARLLDHLETIVAAIKIAPSNFQWASDRLKREPSVLRAFVHMTAEHKGKEFDRDSSDHDVAQMAVGIDYRLFGYLPLAQQQDVAVFLEASTKAAQSHLRGSTGEFLQYVSSELLQDKQFVEQVFLHSKEDLVIAAVFSKASNEVRNDVVLARRALLAAVDLGPGTAAELYVWSVGDDAKRDKQTALTALRAPAPYQRTDVRRLFEEVGRYVFWDEEIQAAANDLRGRFSLSAGAF